MKAWKCGCCGEVWISGREDMLPKPGVRKKCFSDHCGGESREVEIVELDDDSPGPTLMREMLAARTNPKG